jgi:hypothetical protein
MPNTGEPEDVTDRILKRLDRIDKEAQVAIALAIAALILVLWAGR